MRAGVRRFFRRHQEDEDATQAARRALAEAEERRRPGALNQSAADKKINGRDGLDPVHYGDWEVKGIASDF